MKKFYSKPLSDISSLKSTFLDDNDNLLEDILLVNKNYSNQVSSNICKACEKPLIKDKVDIKKHGVTYQICKNCSHLNGNFLDSEIFCNSLYVDSDGTNYSENYKLDYLQRVENIYKPKVRFLLDTLSNSFEQDKLVVDDYGCGGGHLVYAFNQSGVFAKGFDVSKDLLDLGSSVWNDSNKFKNPPPFKLLKNESQIIEEILKTKADVISFQGVLEHLRFPNKVFQSFKKSNAKFLYLSVPLFSLSVFIENVFPSVYPRQLGGAHTNLYTQDSLEYIFKKYNLSKVAEWIFGMDSLDLKRSLISVGYKNEMSEDALSFFNDRIFTDEVLEEMQKVLDKSHSSSDTHIILKK